MPTDPVNLPEPPKPVMSLQHLHHARADRHTLDQPCPVEARVRALLNPKEPKNDR